MARVRLICVLCAFALWQLPAGAQNVPDAAVPLDGPALTVETDSLDARIPRGIMPMPVLSPAMTFDMFSRMPAPTFETRQSRALRADLNAMDSVIPSVRNALSQSFRPVSPQNYMLMSLAGLFFTPQFAIPYGYQPLMNQSNPFMVAKIPGWAPVEDKYSPDVIPQAVELEYDFATGTYKQKMVDWNVYQKRLSTFNPSNFNTAPVPRIPVNDVERRIMSGML